MDDEQIARIIVDAMLVNDPSMMLDEQSLRRVAMDGVFDMVAVAQIMSAAFVNRGPLRVDP